MVFQGGVLKERSLIIKMIIIIMIIHFRFNTVQHRVSTVCYPELKKKSLLVSPKNMAYLASYLLKQVLPWTSLVKKMVGPTPGWRRGHWPERGVFAAFGALFLLQGLWLALWLSSLAGSFKKYCFFCCSFFCALAPTSQRKLGGISAPLITSPSLIWKRHGAAVRSDGVSPWWLLLIVLQVVLLF